MFVLCNEQGGKQQMCTRVRLYGLTVMVTSQLYAYSSQDTNVTSSGEILCVYRCYEKMFGGVRSEVNLDFLFFF